MVVEMLKDNGGLSPKKRREMGVESNGYMLTTDVISEASIGSFNPKF